MKTYKKNKNGNTIGFNIKYEEHVKILKSLEITFQEDGSITLPGGHGHIPLKHVKMFSLHGEWDDPTFTDNERRLAWRIECITNQ